VGNDTCTPIDPAPGLFGRIRGPIVVDLFAGAGGASEGVRRALGYGPIVAINHCRHAIDMHKANHPDTEHFWGDVFEVRPLAATRGRSVDALWGSPDCRHFSRAKGGQPVDKKIRGLAWVMLRWAAKVRPRVIFMENVSELVTWGPLARPARGGQKHLGANGSERRKRWNKPIAARKGELFQLFVSHLRALGYVVEWRNLMGCDYGAPTSRKRFYMVARRDGQPIVWPEPTHCAPSELYDDKGNLLAKCRKGSDGAPLRPWRTASECIDWSIPMLSIFATPDEAKAWAKAVGADGVPQRPLAEATLARIREGVRRFVLDNPKPFLVTIDQQSTKHTAAGCDEPVSTVTVKNRHAVVSPIIAKAHANGSDTAGSGIRSAGDPAPTMTTTEQFAVLAPMLQTLTHGQRHEALDAPMRTVTGAHRGERVVVSPVMVANNANNAPHGAGEPLGTVTGGGRHIVAAAHLIETRNGEREGQAPRVRDIERPLGTTTAKGSQGAVVAATVEPLDGRTRAGRAHRREVAAFMAKHYGGVTGTVVDQPIGTITGVDHHSPVAVFMEKFHGSAAAGQPADAPAPTVTSGGGRGGGHAGPVAVFLEQQHGKSRGRSAAEPLGTATAVNHHAAVSAFLSPYYGSERDGQCLDEPVRTVTTKDRLGLVTTTISGTEYAIVDIAMRMLQPPELAAANGWADMIRIGTKAEQVARIGNMVLPDVVAALFTSNLGELAEAAAK